MVDKVKLQTPNSKLQTPKLSQLKIAIVHDWLVGGGAEKVVEAMHEMFPEAPIFTSYCTDYWQKRLDNKVVTGFLQHWPLSKLRKFLPVLRIWWFEHLDLRDYDIVLSSSGNGEAKSVKRLRTSATHICYCHSPTHFYWDKYEEYLHNPGFGIFNPLARLGLKVLVGPLRKYDLKVSQRPNFFIANSTHIQKMIKKYYGRDSVVIHPPVDTTRFRNSIFDIQNTKKGFVTIGRLTPYKRVDIIVEACSELELPLKVLGSGPELNNLKTIAADCVTFSGGYASDKQVEEALASSLAFIFAAYEDFGIVPVEAMAAGVPVIAYKAGGALDYVTPKTGIFFEDQTVDSLKQALNNFDAKKFKQNDLIHQANKFNKQNFKNNILEFIITVI